MIFDFLVSLVVLAVYFFDDMKKDFDHYQSTGLNGGG